MEQNTPIKGGTWHQSHRTKAALGTQHTEQKRHLEPNTPNKSPQENNYPKNETN